MERFGFLIVGQAEQEPEVFGRESTLWVVLVEAGNAGDEWLAQTFVGVVWGIIVDDVRYECEGQGRVYAVAPSLTKMSQPTAEAWQEVVFVGHGRVGDFVGRGRYVVVLQSARVLFCVFGQFFRSLFK